MADDIGIRLEDDSSAGFVVERAGPPGVFGVFEDDGETGYLYIYEPGGREIFRHLHIYDRRPKVQVSDEDVRVVWSTDFAKCGVVIWQKMRGIVDLSTGQEGRVWLEDRNSLGIGDVQWLKGFQA